MKPKPTKEEISKTMSYLAGISHEKSPRDKKLLSKWGKKGRKLQLKAKKGYAQGGGK